MDNQHKELSLKFYSFLCDIIGNKTVVNKRRHILTIMDDHFLNSDTFQISSGSKAEGLDLKGSDFDIMKVSNFVQVYEHLDQVKSSDEKIPLIMDTRNVKPGFAKLLIHHSIQNKLPSSLIDWRTGFPYLSSTMFLQSNCDMYATLDIKVCIHGPCAMMFDGDLDNALSLHCSNWISQALPWISRSKYSWASSAVVNNILRFGVLFVPIGCKYSPTSDLEWRISFSHAEKQLIFCFNHVQLLCYALLKIVLNDIIKKIFGDLLCSYFMKTIMFWLCEETKVSYWRPENMLSCFMTCFRRLIYCVENKNCLHYFIPENNFFENRFERQHKKLLSTLHGLYDLGWTFLLQTATLQSFWSYLERSLSAKKSFATFFPFLGYLDSICFGNFLNYAAAVKRCVLQLFRPKRENDIYVYLISGIFQCFPQIGWDDDLVQGNNKELYKNFRRILTDLLIGVNHDAVSGWSLLASFFYVYKQYRESKILIDYCLSKFTKDRFESIFDGRSKRKVQRYIAIQNYIGPRCLKNYHIATVNIKQTSRIIPDELKIITEESSGIHIPALVYVHFLNFLYYHTIGDKRMRKKSYRKLVSIDPHECVFDDRNMQITSNCLRIAKNIMH